LQVLAFSPIGDAFRDRLRAFPSLINCCTIDWCATLLAPHPLAACCGTRVCSACCTSLGRVAKHDAHNARATRGRRFQAWPEDALSAVAAARLKALDVPPDTRASLQGLCRAFHTSVEGLSARFKSQVRACGGARSKGRVRGCVVAQP
jgi:dynein heavy chain, axonemal